MARIATILSVLVSAATIQTALAGPSCAYRYKGKPECVEKCKGSWGWSDGLLNSNPWGSVVVSTEVKTKIENYIAQACGSSVPSSVPASTSVTPAPPASSTAAASVSIQPAAAAAPTPSDKAVKTTSTTVSTSDRTFSTPPSLVKVSSTAVNAAPTTVSRRPVSSSSSSPAPAPTSSSVSIAPKPSSTTVKATPTTSSAPAATSAAAGGSGSTSATDIAAYLKGHNDVRRNHGAADLTWSDELASAAQKWANNCEWKHSGGAVGKFGENLSAGTNLGIPAAIKMWTDEVSEYDPANPQFSHFTQVVWKATTQVGCAVQTCNGLLGGNSAIKFYVCEYNPAGNVLGRFGENV
ncbi:PR-1-like protein [Coprinellus micaceus]|uniref:PR-1-like protein n=1 Tax=Coprinellus micaceus TaxID=71717 RepID=A0A4Y7TYG2_COPMI|nr:PR-1-like protein [Coprinellus micaceus]